MSAVINILAILGFIILLSYLISYIYYYFLQKTNQTIQEQVNPPSSYMQTTGIKCPDYWVNTGVDDDGNYICKNMFNLGVEKKTTTSCSSVACNDTNDNKIIKFSKVDPKQTWMPNNPDGKTSMSDKEKYDFVNTKGIGQVSRCDWIKCCGAKDSTKGVWQGVESTCSYNPSTASITS